MSALVTWKTGRPAKIVYTREESLSPPVPGMRWRSRSEWARPGRRHSGGGYVRAVNTGAYGEHGPTTVGLVGHKSLALYGKMGSLPL